MILHMVAYTLRAVTLGRFSLLFSEAYSGVLHFGVFKNTPGLHSSLPPRAPTDPTLRDFLVFGDPPRRLDFFRSTFRADAHNRARARAAPEWGPCGKYLQLTSLHNKRTRHRVHGPVDPGPAGEGVARRRRTITARYLPDLRNPIAGTQNHFEDPDHSFMVNGTD